MEKLRTAKSPKIVSELPDALRRWLPDGKGTMVVSTPEEVESIIQTIPPGQALTLTQLRAEIAHRHGATIACPMSTAIFVNLVARAWVEEEERTGKTGAPWWRVLRGDGSANPKFPGGAVEQLRRLRAEGWGLE